MRSPEGSVKPALTAKPQGTGLTVIAWQNVEQRAFSRFAAVVIAAAPSDARSGNGDGPVPRKIVPAKCVSADDVSPRAGCVRGGQCWPAPALVLRAGSRRARAIRDAFRDTPID